MPDQLYNTVVKNASYNLYGLLGPFYWRLKEQSLTQITCQQTRITLPLQNCEKEGPLTKLVYLKSHHVSSYLYHYLD